MRGGGCADLRYPKFSKMGNNSKRVWISANFMTVHTVTFAMGGSCTTRYLACWERVMGRQPLKIRSGAFFANLNDQRSEGLLSYLVSSLSYHMGTILPAAWIVSAGEDKNESTATSDLA